MCTLRGHKRTVTCVEWSPDGSQLATGSLDHTMRLWDVTTVTEMTEPMQHTGFVKSIAWSPDRERSRLAAASSNGTVRLSDLSAGKLALTLHMTPRGNSSVRCGPNGARLAAVVGEAVQIWDATVGYERP